MTNTTHLSPSPTSRAWATLKSSPFDWVAAALLCPLIATGFLDYGQWTLSWQLGWALLIGATLLDWQGPIGRRLGFTAIVFVLWVFLAESIWLFDGKQMNQRALIGWMWGYKTWPAWVLSMWLASPLLEPRMARGKPVSIRVLAWLVVLLASWQMAAAPAGLNPEISISHYRLDMGTYFAGLVVLMRLFERRAASLAFLFGFAVVCAAAQSLASGAMGLVAAFATPEFLDRMAAPDRQWILFHYDAAHSWRLQFPLLEHNRLGAAAVANFFLFALALSFVRRGALRYTLIAFMALAFAISLMTMTRGSTIAIALGVAPFLIFRARPVATVVVFAALIAVFAMPASRRDHLLTVFNRTTWESPETSIGRRVTGWRGASLLIGDHPLAGAGYGMESFRLAYDNGYRQQVKDPELKRHSHNTPMEFAAESGLPALALFLALTLWRWQMLVRALRWRPRDPAALWLAGYEIAAFAFFQLFWMLKRNQGFLFWTIWIASALIAARIAEAGTAVFLPTAARDDTITPARPTPQSIAARIRTRLAQRFADPATRNLAALLALCTAVCGAGAAIMIYATTWGAGLYPDSTKYLDASTNFLEGNGFIFLTNAGFPHIMTHWPPLYPLSVAAISAMGFTALEAARILAVFLYSANAALVAFVLRRLLPGSIWIPVFGAALFVLGSDMIATHSVALSEPLFIFLGIAGLYMLSAHGRRPDPLLLVGGAIAIALAAATRYVGVSLLATGGLAMLLLNRRKFIWRIVDAGIFSVIASMPSALWTERNTRLTGAATNRQVETHYLEAKDLKPALDTFTGWVSYASWPRALQYAALGISILAFLATVALLAKSFWRKDSGAAGGQAPERGAEREAFIQAQIFPLFLFLLVAILLVSRNFFDAGVTMDWRQWAPAYAALAIYAPAVLGMWVRNARLSFSWKTALVTLCALYVGMGAVESRQFSQERHNNGAGYASKKWIGSSMMRRIRNNINPGLTIYSNAPDAIRMIAGRRASMIPYRIFSDTQMPNPQYDSVMASIVAEVNAGNATVIYFTRHRQGGELPNLLLMREFGMKVRKEYKDSIQFGPGLSGQEATDRSLDPERD